MPRKFAAENLKAVASRERKEAQKEAETLKKQQQQDDADWQDDDKQLMKKQQRKDDQLKKKEQQQSKKAEVKKLLEKETNSIKSAARSVVKVTRAQISKATGASGAFSASNEKKKLLMGADDDAALMMELEGNVNRLALDDGEEARSVDRAILLLNGDNNKSDKHLVKRIRAAHMAFEERRLKELKKENPALRMSQLKEIVWREWQKAPENPKNQL